MFTIAIVGRPNVGKSTLFNRLTRKQHALVHDLPGVTRDRREGEGELAGLDFRLIDTAGLEDADSNSLEGRMLKQTEAAVDEADLCVFVVDGRVGLTPLDTHFATWLRKKDVPTVTLVNKCEGKEGEEGFHEAIALGFDQCVAISAAHGEGLGGMFEAIEPYIQQYQEGYGANTEYEGQKQDNSGGAELSLAVVGRPNAGKSTFINQLLKQERLLTGPEAGITRDSIAIPYAFNGVKMRLVDTAGMRKRANVKKKLEKLSVSDSIRAIKYAQAVVLMLDAELGLEKQDLTIADYVINEGRCLIIAVNKWDLISEHKRKKLLEELDYELKKTLPQIKGVPVIPVSALTGKDVEKVLEQATELFQLWDKRIPTGPLNEWLHWMEEKHPPPMGKNKRRVRLKYITQGKRRPPTFMLFTNLPKDVNAGYVRYLVNSMREHFEMPGVPIRILLRSAKNPYQAKR